MTRELLEAVQEVARVEGAEAMRRFQSPRLAVERKSDGTPVTDADRAAEEVAREWIAKRFPNDGIVGEEFGSTPKARTWFLDPIDGTKAFIRGVPLWGSMVGVADGEEPIAGAVAYPALGELLSGAKGQGAWHNETRCQVSRVSSLAEATVLTSEARHGTEGLRRLQERCAVSRTWGDCYGYLLVATGRAEAMVDPVLASWDSAPFKPIIEEAGGVFTDMAGAARGLGGSGVATNAALAKEIRAVLAEGSTAARVAGGALQLEAPADAAALSTVVAQDARTGEVLMVAFADAHAIELSKTTGLMHYTSRKRGLWKKGETSGHTQRVVSLTWDCDRDALLARVISNGPACHTNSRTCFDGAPDPDALTALDRLIRERAGAPQGPGYTRKLLADENLRLKKLGEEAAELIVALVKKDGVRAAEEAADLTYHLLVALRAAGVGLDEMRDVLDARARADG